MSRSTLTISEDHKDRFDTIKQESETVDEAFGRLLDVASEVSTDTDGGDAGEEQGLTDILNRLDDLEASIPKRTADELESRLRR